MNLLIKYVLDYLDRGGNFGTFYKHIWINIIKYFGDSSKYNETIKQYEHILTLNINNCFVSM